MCDNTTMNQSKSLHVKLDKKIMVHLVAVIGTVFSACFGSGSDSFAAGKSSTEPALTSIRELIDHQQFAEALPILSGLIGRNPDATEAYALRGVCYFRQEEFERALRDFQEYFKTAKEPVPLVYHRLYGLALCQFEKFPQALEQFNIDIKREPKVWDYWFDRTQLYTVTKHYDKALADANVMVSLKPDNYRHALRARIYVAMGNYQKALEDWNEAIRQASDRRDYYDMRANCYDKLGKTELAAKDRKRRDAGLD
ncbi:MAG: tetratricopeptide repeat protein [Candidatus Obscuribacterales bacterium]|nr:tetratricopeptide repeat protein [Candidatus Obscuribacterales bacterium]